MGRSIGKVRNAMKSEKLLKRIWRMRRDVPTVDNCATAAAAATADTP